MNIHSLHIAVNELADGFIIGEWRVKPKTGCLVSTLDGATIRRLEPKQMRVLLTLASRPNRTITRDELVATVWRGRIVAEGSLSVAIHHLRRSLGDDAKLPEYIQTLPGRGYKLVAKPVPVGRPGTSGRSRVMVAAAILMALALPLSSASLLNGRGTATVVGAATEFAAISVPPVLNMTGDRAVDALAGSVTARLRRTLRPAGGGTFANLMVEASIHAEAAGPALFIHVLDQSRGTVLWSARSLLPAGDDALGVELASLSEAILGTVSGRRATTLFALERPVRVNFLRARHLVLKGDGRALQQGVLILEAIVRDHPDEPEILVTAAEAAMRQFEMGSFDRSLLDTAEARAIRASAIDANNPLARGIVAQVRFLKYWDTEAAETGFATALASAPGSNVIRRRFARFLIALGRYDEAIRHLTIARMEYADPTAEIEIARAMFLAGQYGAVVRSLEKSLPDMQNPGPAYRLLAASNDAMGKSEESFRWLQSLYSRTDYGREFMVEVKAAYDESGAAGYYGLLLARILDAQNRGAAYSPAAIAEIAAAAGRPDMAREYLEKAIEVRDPGLFTVARRPSFLSLRTGDRHRAIFDRIAAVLPS